MKAFVLYTALLLGCSNYSSIEENIALTGKVIKIIDGDTFDVLTARHTVVRIRMNGIDCPERSQDYYQVCKDALSSYIAGDSVRLITYGKDRYKRTIADVFNNNKNINLVMVKNGFAWHFKRYSTDRELAKAERDARQARIGLWQMDNPTPPWNFRRPEKGRRAHN